MVTETKPWIAPEFPKAILKSRALYDVGAAVGLGLPADVVVQEQTFPKMVYRSYSNSCVYLLYSYAVNRQDCMMVLVRPNANGLPRVQEAWVLTGPTSWREMVLLWTEDIEHHVLHGKRPKERLLLYLENADVS